MLISCAIWSYKLNSQLYDCYPAFAGLVLFGVRDEDYILEGGDLIGDPPVNLSAGGVEPVVNGLWGVAAAVAVELPDKFQDVLLFAEVLHHVEVGGLLRGVVPVGDKAEAERDLRLGGLFPDAFDDQFDGFLALLELRVH